MKENWIDSKHFRLEKLADGVYATIHKTGGGAYSNSGIIDLGDITILVDAFDTMAAGGDLRKAAELLMDRPVEMILLTHPHSDHWIGASAFEPRTVLLANEKTRQVCREWGKQMMKDYQKPEEWEAWIGEMEAQLQIERDEDMRAGLLRTIERTQYSMAEMGEFQPRYADLTFEQEIRFHGEKRKAIFKSFGHGHSEDDAALLLPEDGVAFIGDIGFFDTQPFLGYCDIEGYRKQMTYFLEGEYDVLVPGHGPIGGKGELQLQLEYCEILEELVGKVVQQGGSLEEAKKVRLPEPFDSWLYGGKGRFEANVGYFYQYCGGVLAEET